MLGTVNRTLLLILGTASTLVTACSEATSPPPRRDPGSPASAVDSVSRDTAPTPFIAGSQPAGDSIRGLVFLRDSAVWQSADASSPPTRLLQLSSAMHGAAVSRTGWIAFVPGATNEVCIAAPGTAEPRCVTSDYYNISWLAWSPDGTRVVFSGWSTMPGCSAARPCIAPRANLLSLSVSSMAVMPLVLTQDGSYALGASWSPDGSVIAFAMNGGIWLVNADGTQPRVLRSDVGGSYAVTGVRWSPDGRRFTVSLEATEGCSWFCDTAVGTVEADGSGLRVLATAAAAANQFVGSWPHGAPIWSPDGSSIAIGRTDCSAGWDPCREQVWAVPAAGGAPQLLLEGATLLAWQDR